MSDNSPQDGLLQHSSTNEIKPGEITGTLSFIKHLKSLNGLSPERKTNYQNKKNLLLKHALQEDIFVILCIPPDNEIQT